MSTVQDALGLGASKIDTAYTAMNKAIDIVNDIKVKVVAAIGASDADKEKIQTEITALQGQLKSYADSATFSGANWLSVNSTVAAGNPSAGTHADAQIVSAFNRDSAGNVTLGTIKINVQDIKLYDAAATTNATKGILEGLRLGTTGERDNTATAAVGRHRRRDRRLRHLDLTVVGFNDAQIAQMIKVVDKALGEMQDAATIARRRQEAGRPAEGLHHQPDGLDRSRRRPARRRRHEQGIDPPPGAAGPAAARHPGAVDRQLPTRSAILSLFQTSVDRVQSPRHY